MAASILHHHIHLLLFVLTIIIILFSSSTHGLTRGSSLSVENKDDLIVSPNGLFTAGFHQVGENAHVFAVWFTASGPRTLVWMANRDAPVNGEKSKLSLWKDGNLVLIDAGQHIIWSTQTKSMSSLLELTLNNTGNLMLHDKKQSIWQSFDQPTDTLLPNQPFTRDTMLVSSRSSSNHSSGYYKLLFDLDSILRLVYDSPETTSKYWPDPRLRTYFAGRFEYIDSRTAVLDSYGQFKSTDGFSFDSADFGLGPQRMMRLDTDGNLRLYSLVQGMKWEVQWQAIGHICRIDGTCGQNSLCTYSRDSGKKCSCVHGFKMVNTQDWSHGCEPEQSHVCKGDDDDDCEFIEMPYTEFYGYDISFHLNTTLGDCKKECLQDNNCKGFNFASQVGTGLFFCFLKSSLHNGYQNGVYGTIYIKLPNRLVSSFNPAKAISESNFSCPRRVVVTPLVRSYEKNNNTKPLGFLIVVGCTIGFIEILCIVFFWSCSSKHSPTAEQMYFPASTGFRRFTYSELKKASRNFSEEIGSGGASVVYKARLKDNRIAAIKKLKNSGDQGEDEFQAEISTIGRMNHMNLIETWGYCTEGKHRLVVYEYMENGSLASNLRLDKLDWATRLNIVIGTAKGLAYLHEECLEWVLHCDVKPHNILLDGNYNPKVADFGLSKRWDRGGTENWNFSMMRGTRGYMAPEWVLNLAITSKVDVYSYGVVVLEMITGRSPYRENGEGLVNWVRERVKREGWVEETVNGSIRGEYDGRVMEKVVEIALMCVEEDSLARPTMSQVVNMLLHM